MKAAGTPRATSTRGRRARRAGVSTAFGRLAGVTPDRAMPQHSLTVGGTQYDVDFPYAPYDCQLTITGPREELAFESREPRISPAPTSTSAAAREGEGVFSGPGASVGVWFVRFVRFVGV